MNTEEIKSRINKEISTIQDEGFLKELMLVLETKNKKSSNQVDHHLKVILDNDHHLLHRLAQ
jgi:hypothetical protein